MSEYIDWDMEDGLQVDHGGIEHAADPAADHQGYTFDEHLDEGADITDISEIADSDVDGDSDSGVDSGVDSEAEIQFGDGEQYIDETDLPEFTFDPSFIDGSYDMLGADPDEEDLWSQLMLDMNDEVNPYATN